MEKRYDVFISYSFDDQKVAEGVCGYLERKGYRCFVAYRDIPRGVVWAAAIADALDDSSMMIVLFSQSFNVSRQTDREIELASENEMPILTFRISDDKMTGAKKYYLKNLNWIDAFPNPENCFGQLLESVVKLIGSKQVEKETTSINIPLDSKGKIINMFDGHDCVDLGLPSGILWATCNVGAGAPEEFGDYYSWGEINTRSICNWGSYKYANGNFDKLIKYGTKAGFGDKGFTDNLLLLQKSDDPASLWGDGWHMPTKVQWDELLNNTANKWVIQNGVGGRQFFSKKNGQAIFLPAAGYQWGDEFKDIGSVGYYWSSFLFADNPGDAWNFYFSSDYNYMGSYYRCSGQSVRAVHEN